MSFTVNLCGEGLLINRFNSSNMSKSKQAKLQRQQERDNKVAFFEAQKENLKNRKADTLEEISEKLEIEDIKAFPMEEIEKIKFSMPEIYGRLKDAKRKLESES